MKREPANDRIPTRELELAAKIQLLHRLWNPGRILDEAINIAVDVYATTDETPLWGVDI